MQIVPSEPNILQAPTLPHDKQMVIQLTSQLWDEGVRSSYFLLVKMSIPTKWHLA